MLNHTNIKRVAVFVSIALVLGIYFANFSLIWLLIWLLLWMGITAYGSFSIQRNFFLKAYHSNPTIDDSFVALTFDDGPHAHTLEILELLKKYDMKATFFCIGKEVENYPEIVQRIVIEGHVVGNHTFTHSNKMGFLKEDEVRLEIEQTNDCILKIIQKEPALFRPPFGVTNPKIATAVQQTEMHVIGWNIRSLDTVSKSTNEILNRVVPKLSKGSIILLHDNRKLTADSLEQLLIILREKQFQSVTIPDLLNINAYKS